MTKHSAEFAGRAAPVQFSGRRWGGVRPGAWPPVAFRVVLRVGLMAAVLAIPMSAQDTMRFPDTLGAEGVEGSSRILVLAAASLSQTLPDLSLRWTGASGVEPRISFDASSRLAPQVIAGAPVDVFISADKNWVDWLVERGAADAAAVRRLWDNEMVVITPSAGYVGIGRSGEDSEPRVAGVQSLIGLERIALAGEAVPAGRYAEAALREAGLWDEIRPSVVRGGSVRSTLEWVARGEVDAGVVYRTDAVGDARVRIAFELPTVAFAGPTYYGVVPAGAPNADAASRFLDFLADDAMSSPMLQLRPLDRTGPFPSEPLVDPRSAIKLSFLVAFAAALLGLAPAVAVGWLFARKQFFGKTLLSTVVLAPLVMPPVVTGFLLLEILGRNALLGGLLEGLGLPVSFTLIGAVIAALVVGFPLYVIAVRGAFEAVDHRYEELSWTLGVPPSSTFRRISLPLALPGIAAGALLAFARALGEFGATVVLAGNLEGETRTIALGVYSLLESPNGRQGTWVLVGASVVLSVVALVGYEALSRRQRRRILEHHDA